MIGTHADSALVGADVVHAVGTDAPEFGLGVGDEATKLAACCCTGRHSVVCSGRWRS